MRVAKRKPGEDGTHIDVLERVLDKGIVLAVWGRLSVVGLQLAGREGRLIVASIEALA